MVTIDLNTEQRWDEVFQRVEAGEVVQVMRGDRLIAFVDPAPAIEPEHHGIAIAAEKELPYVWPLEDFSDGEDAR